MLSFAPLLTHVLTLLQVDVPWVSKAHFRGVIVGWDSECRQTDDQLTYLLAYLLPPPKVPADELLVP